MILKTKSRYFIIKNPIIRDVLSILKQRKVCKTKDFLPLQKKYGRKKIYSVIKLLDKFDIVEIRKTLFPKRLLIYYKCKEVYILELSLIILTISSTILYLLSISILNKVFTAGIFGLVIGILSTISLFLILYVKLILERLEVL